MSCRLRRSSSAFCTGCIPNQLSSKISLPRYMVSTCQTIAKSITAERPDTGRAGVSQRPLPVVVVEHILWSPPHLHLLSLRATVPYSYCTSVHASVDWGF